MADTARGRRARRGSPAPETAMELAIRYLGARPRTRWEIERRLQRAGVADTVLEATLERLAELGYLDDAAFARWWAEQRDRHAPRGRRMIEAELRQRGIGRDVLEAHRDEHGDPERAPEDVSLPSTEEERADEALARHLRGRPFPEDVPARRRIGMFLVRRGFDPETVRGSLRRAAVGADGIEPR